MKVHVPNSRHEVVMGLLEAFKVLCVDSIISLEGDLNGPASRVDFMVVHAKEVGTYYLLIFGLAFRFGTDGFIKLDYQKIQVHCLCSWGKASCCFFSL